MEQKRWILVGLGNPGQRYAHNRHNVGFQCIDRLARSHHLTFDKRQGNGRLAVGNIRGHSVILLKPQSFMNESGRSVAQLCRYYKVPLERLLVVFDELDLPLGSVRLRSKGGSSGHKGMRSIIKQLGSQEFPRVRVGIGRPPGRMDPADYVLQNFRDNERPIIEDVYGWVACAMECWMEDGIEIAMTRFNRNLLDPDGRDTSLVGCP